MTPTYIKYKKTGIERLSGFKNSLLPNDDVNNKAVNDFVNLFCEYQLADNNYLDIHLEASANNGNEDWFDQLTIDQVLRYITYIIWTDKFSEGFLNTKVKDRTMYLLVSRLEKLVPHEG